MTITLMDGCMAAELARRDIERSTPTAVGRDSLSARPRVLEALLDNPELIRSVHNDYIDSGVDVVTMATLGITPIQLCREGLESHLDELIWSACRAACAARDEAERPIRIAACLGPLSPEPARDKASVATLIGVYEYLLHMMASDADLIFCVGLATVREAEAAGLAAAMTAKPIWLSFAVDHRAPACLLGGEPLVNAVRAIDGVPVGGLLIQGQSPQHLGVMLSSLLPLARFSVGCQLGLDRMNETVDGKTDALSVEALGYLVEDWIDSRATIIGGGSGVSPAHVAHLRSLIDIRPADGALAD